MLVSFVWHNPSTPPPPHTQSISVQFLFSSRFTRNKPFVNLYADFLILLVVVCYCLQVP